MSKANFYRIPVKTKTVYAPRRRQRSALESRGGEPWQRGRAYEENRTDDKQQTGRAPEPGAAYHPAPQFRRNRRFWLRRLGLDKAPR